MRAVLDTNILVDYLNGFEEARLELKRYQKPAISIITQIEILVGVTEGEEGAVRAFLATFEVIGIDPKLADEAVKIRRETRMKVPDAIVYATARREGCWVVSRNTRDFDESWPDVRVPYRI